MTEEEKVRPVILEWNDIVQDDTLKAACEHWFPKSEQLQTLREEVEQIKKGVAKRIAELWKLEDFEISRISKTKNIKISPAKPKKGAGKGNRLRVLKMPPKNGGLSNLAPFKMK